MKVSQYFWSENAGWIPRAAENEAADPKLVLFFGVRPLLERSGWFEQMRSKFPTAYTLGCSTAGEILGDEVLDEALVATAVSFDDTRLEGASAKVTDFETSFAVGQKLATSISHEGLSHVSSSFRTALPSTAASW